MPKTEHLPQRPSWDCRACGAEWPCGPGRKELCAEAGGSTWLAILMWGYLEEYCGDAGPGPLRAAFDRFIGWTRRPAERA